MYHLSQQQPQEKARPIRRLARSAIPGSGHENTAASKANAKVEKSLMSDLNQYVNLIRSELDKTQTFQWSDLHSRIMPTLKPSVMQTMRGHLSQSYELGAQYVTDKTGLGAGAFFLTHSDIDNIKTLAETYTDKFFGRVVLSLNSTIRKSVVTTTRGGRSRKLVPQPPADSTINPNYIVNSLAISATTTALAEGTRNKARSLLLNTRTGSQAVLSAAAETEEEKKKRKRRAAAALLEREEAAQQLDPDLLFEDDMQDEIITGTFLGVAAGISLALLAGAQLQEQNWVWITAADDRVCDICEPLEGEVYSMEDIDTAPRPIDDTHETCRCRLLLL